MGRAVKVQLNGERLLVYGIGNTRLATSALQALMPRGREEKLKMSDAAMLVYQNDLDAVLIFLQGGLQHQDKNLDIRELEKWLDKEVRPVDAGGNGRMLREFSRPILAALKAANLIDIVYEPAGGSSGAESGAGRDTEDEEEGGTRPIREIKDRMGG